VQNLRNLDIPIAKSENHVQYHWACAELFEGLILLENSFFEVTASITVVFRVVCTIL